MNPEAIRTNEGADSRLPGVPNFIVDFTFSPLCCVLLFLRLRLPPIRSLAILSASCRGEAEPLEIRY